MSSQPIDQLVTNFYELLSFDVGRQPDWEGLRRLFHTKAVIVPSVAENETQRAFLTVTEFFDRFSEEFRELEASGFRESELFNSTVMTGDIASRMSLYRIACGSTEIPLRGANYFHFVRQSDGWLISYLAWDTSLSTATP